MINHLDQCPHCARFGGMSPDEQLITLDTDRVTVTVYYECQYCYSMTTHDMVIELGRVLFDSITAGAQVINRLAADETDASTAQDLGAVDTSTGTLFVGHFAVKFTVESQRVTWRIARDKHVTAQGVSTETDAYYDILHALSRAFAAQDVTSTDTESD